MKFDYNVYVTLILQSLPVRGAWIEMLPQLIATFVSGSVAPRAGSVD